jgi:hypothetical protein
VIRVLVTGGRGYADHRTVFETLSDLHDRVGIACIIQGGATGADKFAHQWAHENGVEDEEYAIPASDWERHGKRAGPMRNRWMLINGRPDRVIAFPGRRGTGNLVLQAREIGLEVTEIGEQTRQP